MMKNQQQATQYQIEPFEFFGYNFHSKRVVLNFLITFLAIFIVPLATFYLFSLYITQIFDISDSNRIMISGIISVLSVWVVMGIYTYSVIVDPENFSYEQRNREQLKKMSNPFVKPQQLVSPPQQPVQKQATSQKEVVGKVKEKLKMQQKQKKEKEQKAVEMKLKVKKQQKMKFD